MSGASPLDTRDQILPNGHGDQSWLQHYSVDAGKGVTDGGVRPSGKSQSAQTSYPYHSYDTVERWDVSVVGNRDAVAKSSLNAGSSQYMTTAGMTILAGVDPATGSRIDRIYDPNDVLQQSPAAVPLSQDPMRAKELQDLQLARSGSAVKPGVAVGLLMVMGRFVAVPIERLSQLMRLWGARLVERVVMPVYDLAARLAVAVWKPVERKIVQFLDWLDRQVKVAQPYVTTAVRWVATGIKKVLDFLIIDGPRTAVAAIKRGLERLSQWLGS